jgi:hypothetical protein
MTDIGKQAARRDVATATWVPTVDAARPWVEAGVRLVTVSSTTALFTGAATTLIEDLRRRH